MLTWNELKPSMDLPKTWRFGRGSTWPPFCAPRSFFVREPIYTRAMPEPVDLTPATQDLAEALAFAPRYSGRKRVRDSGEIMARIVAERLVGRPRGQAPAYRA
jgi:hypothetical protein